MVITFRNSESPFILLDRNRLTIPDSVIVRAEHPSDGLKLSVKNGTESRIYPLDKETDITEMIKAGRIDFALTLYDGIDVVQRWQVEPLVCVFAENHAEVIPQIEELKNQIELTKKAVYELAKIVKGE